MFINKKEGWFFVLPLIIWLSLSILFPLYIAIDLSFYNVKIIGTEGKFYGMKNYIKISKTINSFNKIIKIEGDKSLSIRWALLASQAIGKSKADNILKSEDVLNTIKCLKNLGVKTNFYKNKCEINGFAAASAFHYNLLQSKEIKRFLIDYKIIVRD